APPRGGEAGSCGPDGLGRTSRSPGGSHLQGPRGGPPPAAGTGGERVPMPMTLAPSHAFAHASTCAAAYVFSVPRRARPVEEQVRAVLIGEGGLRDPRGDLLAGVEPELAVDVGDVPRDGRRSDVEPLGDLPVAHAPRDEAGDLPLARGERAPGRPRRLPLRLALPGQPAGLGGPRRRRDGP